jgi:radical SAM protein with 4Fe4S-binding SPASM domain
MGFEGFPFILGWELTLSCNLRCRHCGSSAGLSRSRELNTQECLDICNQFPELFVQEVNFTGGEPLLRSDWVEISIHLNELGIASKILTNGLALNQDTIVKMKKAHISGVGVSLDGLESTHDYIRSRTNLFRSVLKGIKQVLDANFPLTVITTVNSLNIRELPLMFSLLKSVGVSRWQVQPVFPLGRADETNELELTDKEYLCFGEFVQKWGALAKEEGFEILPGDSFGYFTEVDTRQPSWRGCPAGLFSCGITSDGKIKGCLSLPDEIIEGNLRQNDLWDIWFNPNSFSYTRQFQTDDLGENCIDCDMSDLCRGGCSAMSYGSTGSFHNDKYCFYKIRENDKKILKGIETVTVKS